MSFNIELPVHLRDIDVMGPRQQRNVSRQYMDTARVELARRLDRVKEGFRSSFILASVRCEYKKPISDERWITVSVWMKPDWDRSLDLGYSIHGPRHVK